MRIAHVMLESLPIVGGAQICVDQLARRQIEAGDEVTVVTANRSSLRLRGALPYELLVMPPGLVWIDRKLARDRPSARKLAGLWLRTCASLRRFELVHAHMAHSAGVMSTAWRMPCPVVVTCHGIDIQQLPSIGYGVSLDRRVARLLTNVHERSDVVTVVGAHMIRDWMRLTRNSTTRQQRLAHIPNGCNSSRISTISSERQAIRLRLGLGTHERAILCVGRNHPKKNFSFCIDLAQRLKNVDGSFRFVLIGEGYEPLLECAERFGLASHFIHGGKFSHAREARVTDFPPDEQLAVMKAADMMILPTLLEGFPLVIPEALACGLPIVTTLQSGVEGVFDPSVVRIVDLSCAATVASAVIDVCAAAQDETFRERCREEGRKVDWTLIANRYRDVYASLVSES